MILKGDCIEVMKTMKPNSVDAIVTDPPYGLEFMGKEWDKLWGENSLGNKPSHSKSPQYLDKWTNQKCLKCGHWINSGTPCKCKEPILEQRPIKNDQFRKMQLWHTQWLTEAYRVLKPGGSMLVMGGTRTSHRLACAIEDSGFIIKDTLMWIYGSGFPKAQDLGKMIDKRGGKDISWFIDYVIETAKERGISKKELTSLFLSKNDKPTGWLYNKSSHTQGLTIEQFNKIKEFLQLPFDSLKEAEREIIGKMKNPATAKAGTFNCSFDEEKKHETAPSTDLAKHWDGFKVGGIKPAYEPIIWAVKPPEGSYVDNVLKWGVGAVNVDECRVGVESHIVHGKEAGKFQPTGGATIKDYHEVKGRFPANVILSHHPECVQVGMKRVKPAIGWKDGEVRVTGKGVYPHANKTYQRKGFSDSDGLETVESWDCHPDCAVRLLDEQSGDKKTSGQNTRGKIRGNGIFGQIPDGEHFGDSGGASRFFYCAKASRAERNAGLEGMEEKPIQINEPHNSKTLKERYDMKAKNNHPTVKPIKLFEWLIKLVTREEQIILDPFIGSGTTAIAAHNAGRKCIGIDKEEEYIEIAKARIKYWKKRGRQLRLL